MEVDCVSKANVVTALLKCECSPLRSAQEDDIGEFGSLYNYHSNIITLNISGLVFETTEETLSRFPHTLLGDPTKRAKFYDHNTDEYFFDRHRQSFEGILYYYQSYGEIRVPPNVCLDIFTSEILFYELGNRALSKLKEREGVAKEEMTPIALPDAKWKQVVWLTFEFPETNAFARVVASVSVCTILLSVTTLCIETLPELKNYKMSNMHFLLISNTTSCFTATIEQDQVPYVDALFVVESVCIFWFLLELVARFISCPSKIQFLKNFVNIVDLVSIVPYFVMTGAMLVSEENNDPVEDTIVASSQTATLAILRVIRLVRVFRILKLSRHIRALQILGKTLKSSVRELGLWIFFILISVILFSSAAYVSEIGLEESYFRSIPDTFWYSLVTMTTVGYGDLRPVTALGKLVGACCAVAGVFTVALPVPIIVSNFNYFYLNDAESAYKQRLMNQNNFQTQDRK